MIEQSESRTDASARRTVSVARWIALAALWVTVGVAPGMWFTSAASSPLPAFGTADLPAWAAWTWLIVMACATFGSVLERQRSRFAVLLCIAIVSRALWDQIMWQQYLLQYTCMLIVIAAARGREVSAVGLLRFIVAAIYLWSGIAKFHFRYLSGTGGIFGTETFADMDATMRSVGATLSAVWELFWAVGLWFPRTRRAAILGLTLMHLIILGVLGPLMMDTNRVVWPWNFTMLALLPVLFWNWRERASIVPGRVTWHHALIGFCFGIAPALSYVGLWSPALSYRLYSARAVDAHLFFTDATRYELPQELREQVKPWSLDEFTGYISVPNLVQAEIDVLPPPSARAYRAVAQRFWQREGCGGAVLIVSSAPHWRTGKRTTTRVDPPARTLAEPR